MTPGFEFDQFSKSLTLPPSLPQYLMPKRADGTNMSCGSEWLSGFRSGCYYLTCMLYDPAEPGPGVELLGSLRMEVAPAGLIASGDLYVANQSWRPSPSMGIPVFPRRDYRYYLRVEQIVVASGDEFTITLGAYAFEKRSWWLRVATWEACVRRLSGPPDYPSPCDYFAGELLDVYGSTMGSMQMGWVSQMFRRGSLEIATTDGVPKPQPRLPGSKPGQELSWESLFAEVGWELRVLEQGHEEGAARQEEEGEGSNGGGDEGDLDELLDSKIWTTAELHYEFGLRRSPEYLDGLLDRDWRYYLLCVSRLSASRKRGVMFDHGFNGGNRIPREGAAIAAAFEFQSEAWGDLVGSMLYKHPELYFRTAVHEIGHTMGLTHQNPAAGHFGFMTTLDTLQALMAQRGLSNRTSDQGGVRFEHELKEALCWSFAPQDGLRLRHYPDYVVRPGGQPFNPVGYRLGPSPYAPVADPMTSRPKAEKGIFLLMEPHPDSRILPLGAPARLELVLSNTLDKAVKVSSLRLSEGFLTVTVRDSGGVERRVQPLIHVIDGEETVEDLPAGGQRAHSLTLLRGDQEYLFPSPGQYHVTVLWNGKADGKAVPAATSTLLVRDSGDRDGDVVAQLISNPDILDILAIGGRKYVDSTAEEILEAALEIEALAPHYRYIVLKHRLLLGADFKSSIKDLGVEKGIVMTRAEIRRLDTWRAKGPKIPRVLSDGLDKQQSMIARQLERVWSFGG